MQIQRIKIDHVLKRLLGLYVAEYSQKYYPSRKNVDKYIKLQNVLISKIFNDEAFFKDNAIIWGIFVLASIVIYIANLLESFATHQLFDFNIVGFVSIASHIGLLMLIAQILWRFLIIGIPLSLICSFIYVFFKYISKLQYWYSLENSLKKRKLLGMTDLDISKFTKETIILYNNAYIYIFNYYANVHFYRNPYKLVCACEYNDTLLKQLNIQGCKCVFAGDNLFIKINDSDSVNIIIGNLNLNWLMSSMAQNDYKMSRQRWAKRLVEHYKGHYNLKAIRNWLLINVRRAFNIEFIFLIIAYFVVNIFAFVINWLFLTCFKRLLIDIPNHDGSLYGQFGTMVGCFILAIMFTISLLIVKFMNKKFNQLRVPYLKQSFVLQTPDDYVTALYADFSGNISTFTKIYARKYKYICGEHPDSSDTIEHGILLDFDN